MNGTTTLSGSMLEQVEAEIARLVVLRDALRGFASPAAPATAPEVVRRPAAPPVAASLPAAASHLDSMTVYGRQVAAAARERNTLILGRVLLDGPLTFVELARRASLGTGAAAKVLKSEAATFTKVGPESCYGISDRRPWALTAAGRALVEAASAPADPEPAPGLRHNDLLDEAFDPKPAASAGKAFPRLAPGQPGVVTTYQRIPQLLGGGPKVMRELMQLLGGASENTVRGAMNRLLAQGFVRRRKTHSRAGVIVRWALTPSGAVAAGLRPTDVPDMPDEAFDPKPAAPSEARADADTNTAKVLRLLAKSPQQFHELATAMDMDSGQLGRLLKRLRGRGRVRKTDPKQPTSPWELTPAGRAAAAG